MSKKDCIIIYTDGSCKAMNTDKSYGGYGIVLSHQDKYKEIYGGQEDTTNNRMEMTAVIKGLEAINIKFGRDIEIYSDSAYIVNCINDKWYIKWERNGWRNSKKQLVENKDLWIEMLNLIRQFQSSGINITFNKVKAHCGIEYNEIADDLANKGAMEILEKRLDKK